MIDKAKCPFFTNAHVDKIPAEEDVKPLIPARTYFYPGRYLMLTIEHLNKEGWHTQLVRILDRDEWGIFYSNEAEDNLFLPAARILAAHPATREEVLQAFAIYGIKPEETKTNGH